jgi:hypothetical protein
MTLRKRCDTCLSRVCFDCRMECSPHSMRCNKCYYTKKGLPLSNLKRRGGGEYSEDVEV